MALLDGENYVWMLCVALSDGYGARAKERQRAQTKEFVHGYVTVPRKARLTLL